MKAKDPKHKLPIILKSKRPMLLKNKLKAKAFDQIPRIKSPMKIKYNYFPMSNSFVNHDILNRDFNRLKMVSVIHKQEFSFKEQHITTSTKQFNPFKIPINLSLQENSLKISAKEIKENNTIKHKKDAISIINKFNCVAILMQNAWRRYCSWKMITRIKKEITLKEQIKGINISKLILLKKASNKNNNNIIKENHHNLHISPSFSDHNVSDSNDISHISLNTNELNTLDDDSFYSNDFQSDNGSSILKVQQHYLNNLNY